MKTEEIIKQRFRDSIAVKEGIIRSDAMVEHIAMAAKAIADALAKGRTLLLCGNGGSASDAQHIAGELVGRFERERRGWPAIALSCDGAVMSSIMNDYGSDHVFERQIEALARPGDVLLGISTSGNSENVYRAIVRAKELGVFTIGLLGKSGGKIMPACDLSIVVPAQSTARIQESHITIGHIICELVESALTE